MHLAVVGLFGFIGLSLPQTQLGVLLLMEHESYRHHRAALKADPMILYDASRCTRDTSRNEKTRAS